MKALRIMTGMLLLLLVSTCDNGGGNGESTDHYDSYRQQCVDRINGFRASIGLPPYERWREAESCADGEAESDSRTGIPHGAFPSCYPWSRTCWNWRRARWNRSRARKQRYTSTRFWPR